MTLLAQFAATGGALPAYIEDVFSTWLYTGNAPSSQSINNGIDLASKGGLVWLKNRSVSTGVGHELYNTNVGAGNFLSSNNTNANTSTTISGTTYGLSSFNSNGFTVNDNWSGENTNGQNIVSWTFRKQPKFFDVVTWTGDGTANRAIPHNLGSVPGMVFMKKTSGTGEWYAWSRAYSFNGGTAPSDFCMGSLDSTIAFNGGYSEAQRFAPYPTSTVFYTGSVTTTSGVNNSGDTYVAYLFAHDAGGFGLTGTDNVISCGSFTCDGTGRATVNLGYEPQWLLLKSSNTAQSWFLIDTMRGWVNGGADNTSDDKPLYPNLSNAEGTDYFGYPTATGFQMYTGNPSGQYIYIAIRRGPMKTPTTGTSVFGLNARTGTGANATVTGSAGVSDAVLIKNRGSAVGDLFASRLTGTGYLETSSTAAEVAAGTTILQANPWDVMDGVKVGTTSTITNASANTYINYLFDRAPGFFDEVCYTGTGAVLNVTHNLRVAPEFMIIKNRTSAGTRWAVYYGDNTSYMYLDMTQYPGGLGPNSGFWNNTSPTSSVFTVGVGAGFAVNNSGDNYVAYLFASCPGVSKFGNYTGTGTTKQIDCGFTGGARFVLIKRTDSTGDWYVWDSARGIVAGNDPYLLLNSTAAEVTGTDYVDTYTGGFEISSTAPAAINANGGTFIYLAIA